jgi:thioredoxin reductase
MTTHRALPVAVIGAGPIGLAAAAHLARRGESMVVIEAGSTVGHSIRAWSHVAMLSPWKYNVDAAARDLLSAAGWCEPAPEEVPSGREWVERYLEPLAALPAIHPHVLLHTAVTAVTRQQMDKLQSDHRDEQPFTLRVRNDWDHEFDIVARAVVDASGTWNTPNPAGANGIPAAGELAAKRQMHYRVPDILGRERSRYAGKRVLVLGSGDTALSALLELAILKEAAPGTSIVWALRKDRLEAVFAAPDQRALPARAALASRVYRLVTEQVVEVLTAFHVQSIAHTNQGLLEIAGQHHGNHIDVTADEIVVATGFRPDLSFLRELRTALDPRLECVKDIASFVDSSVHGCGNARPHGVAQLSHPESNFYIVGSKSFGRAPTFLAMTGYEQVRSVIAELAGDQHAAARVELEWPETAESPIVSAELLTTCCAPKSPTPAALNWPTRDDSQWP